VFSVRGEVNFYMWHTSQSCFKWLWERSLVYLWFTIKIHWKEQTSYSVVYCRNRPVRIVIATSLCLRHNDCDWNLEHKTLSHVV
jgi:hypothetical protein